MTAAPTCVVVEHGGHILLRKGVVGVAHQQTRLPDRAVSDHHALQHDRSGCVCHDRSPTTIITSSSTSGATYALLLRVLPPVAAAAPPHSAVISSFGGRANGVDGGAGAASSLRSSLPPPRGEQRVQIRKMKEFPPPPPPVPPTSSVPLTRFQKCLPAVRAPPPPGESRSLTAEIYAWSPVGLSVGVCQCLAALARSLAAAAAAGGQGGCASLERRGFGFERKGLWRKYCPPGGERERRGGKT